MTKRNLQQAFNRFDKVKKQKDIEIPGLLGFTLGGENIVEVPNRSSFVYVRLRSNQNEVIQAFNDNISPVYGLPVVVIRDETVRTNYRVKGKDIGRYQNWGGTAYLPRHGNQHSFNLEAGGGGDITFVYNRQFMPLAVHPSGSSGAGSVYIQPYVYYHSAVWKYAGGTGTASLLPYNPSTGARMVLVYLDNDGNPQLLPGDVFPSNITGNAAILPYIPPLGGTTDVPLAAVRLVPGSSALTWANIYDLRPIIVADGFIPTGTAVRHEIQKDGVAVADQPALNFVGSNFSVYNVGLVTNVSGTVSSAPGGGSNNTIAIYDDGVFKVSGTGIDFRSNLDVSVTGSIAYIQGQAGGGGGAGALPVYDDSVFKATGSAISFDDNLTVAVTGTVVFVNQSGGSGYTQGARVYNSTGTSTLPATGASLVLAFDQEFYDTDNIHSGSSSQLYCNTAGVYHIAGQAQFASNATAGWRMLHIVLNGTTTISKLKLAASANVDNAIALSTIWNMNQGDYVELLATSNVTAAVVQATGSYSPHFMMQRIG